MANSEVEVECVRSSRSHWVQRAAVTWPRDRVIVGVLVAALLGTALCFRLMHLSSIPGINGDEGWWGVHGMSWLRGQPYAQHTTSGNPVDMFYLVPVGLLHAFAPPSFALLRAIPVLANLLALALGFWLLRRLYGETTAWIQTLALAIAPTAIAHSRFCQEPSQSILWTSIVVYLSLLAAKGGRRAWVYALAAFLVLPVVLWTHPTNVFVAPFLVLPLLTLVRGLWPASRRGRVFVGLSVAGLAVGLVSVVGPALAHLGEANRFLNKPWFALAGARLSDAAQWLEYTTLFGRLFSGVTIYNYFALPDLAAAPYDAFASAVAIAIACGMVLALRSERPALDYGLLIAWACTIGLHFAFGGPEAIRPHLERWGLCLIVPTLLVVSRGLTAWIEAGPRVRWWAIGAASVLAAGQLASFHANYFHEFQTSGGRSHRTFITAEVEPKQVALESILARRSGDEPVVIIAREWWQFWPINYLARNYTNVFVNMTLDVEGQPWFKQALDRGQLYFVDFAGAPDQRSALKWVRVRGLRATASTILDAGGRDLLAILQVTRAN